MSKAWIDTRWLHTNKENDFCEDVDVVAYKVITSHVEENPWIKNTGNRLVRKSAKVEYKMIGDDEIFTGLAGDLYWDVGIADGTITHFRFAD